MMDPQYPGDVDRDTAAPKAGLTREMKLLLGALPVLLLAGGLAFYFNGRNSGAETEVITQSTSSTTVQSGDGTSTSASTVSVSTVTQAPGTETGSEAIPPLSEVPTASGITTGTQTAGTGGEKPGTAGGGINPSTPLAAVPARNPFKPLELVSDGSTPTGNVGSGASSAGGGSESSSVGSFGQPSVALSPPSSFSADSSPSGSGSSGSVGVSSGTGSSISRSPTSGSSTTWVLSENDTPVSITRSTSSSSGLPGSSGTSASSSGLGSSGSSGGSTAGSTASRGSGGVAWTFDDPANYPEAVPAGSLGSSGSSGAAGAGAAPGSSSAPSSASSSASNGAPGGPVAGVSEPALGTALNDRAASGTGSGLSLPLPTPAQPSLVTRYGDDQGVGAPDDGTALSRALNRQNLRFTGAVLGPRDTAIFKSSQGFMVLAKGDRLPDTDIVVQQITANSVTLALGQDSLKLELEPLQ